MSKKTPKVSHPGVIEEVTETHFKVKILSQSSCGSCTLKGACPMTEMEEKIVDINRNDLDYKAGEQVLVTMQESLGMWAVFFSYLLPFLLVLIVLIIATSLLDSQGLAGLLSLAVLAIYYPILYLFRSGFRKKFRFDLV